MWDLSCGCSPTCGTRFEVLENGAEGGATTGTRPWTGLDKPQVRMSKAWSLHT